MAQLIKTEEVKNGDQVIAPPGIMIANPGGKVMIPFDDIIPTVERMLEIYLEIQGNGRFKIEKSKGGK